MIRVSALIRVGALWAGADRRSGSRLRIVRKMAIMSVEGLSCARLGVGTRS